MTNISPSFSDLALRAMVKPEEIDIRKYKVIPFNGKLKTLTGLKHTPFKMIHFPYGKRKITIQVFYLKDEKIAYINDMVYEKYKSDIITYFTVDPKEMLMAPNNGSIGISTVDSHLQTYKSQEGAQWDKSYIKEAETENTALKKGPALEGSVLKDYLLSNFGDREYKRKSIIEIYFYDRNHFISLKREKKIAKEAIDFFNHSCFLLEEAQKIPTEAFRKLRYDEIVSEYIKTHTVIREEALESSKPDASKERAEEKGLSEKSTCSIQKKTDVKETGKVILLDNVIKANTDQDISLHCVKDYQKLIKCDEARVHNKKDKEKTFIILKMPFVQDVAGEDGRMWIRGACCVGQMQCNSVLRKRNRQYLRELT